MMVQSEGFVLRPGSREIQQVHALQLHLLSEVDRLCRAHGIHYYLLFGTLLGAVRHAGFIPWDDDVDIGVKRDDYDRLLDLLELELDPERYFIQTAANDAGITIPFAKVRCQKTIFEEYNAPVGAEYHQGVFLDIFNGVFKFGHADAAFGNRNRIRAVLSHIRKACRIRVFGNKRRLGRG